jgi:predicted GIY-YIG superfamily endonuclease
MSTYIYWIHYPEHTDPMTEGYIGVSKHPQRRYDYHSSEKYNNNQHLYRAMLKGCVLSVLETFEDNAEAYLREETYRPTGHIGFNIIPGGGEHGRPPAQWGHTHRTNNGQQIHTEGHKKQMSKRFSASTWWTDGKTSRRLSGGEQPPAGWWKGKTDKRSKTT